MLPPSPPASAPLASLPVHDGIEVWMAAALTGGLASDDERRRFEEHLAGCAGCRELFTEETAMNETIENAFAAVHPPTGFEQRLTAAFRRRREAGFGVRLRAFVEGVLRRPAARVAWSVAGVLALVIVGANLTHETPWFEPFFSYTQVKGSRGIVDRSSFSADAEVPELTAAYENALPVDAPVNGLVASNPASTITRSLRQESTNFRFPASDAVPPPANAKRGPISDHGYAGGNPAPVNAPVLDDKSTLAANDSTGRDAVAIDSLKRKDTYTGSTSINGGTLHLDGSSSLGDSRVSDERFGLNADKKSSPAISSGGGAIAGGFPVGGEYAHGLPIGGKVITPSAFESSKSGETTAPASTPIAPSNGPAPALGLLDGFINYGYPISTTGPQTSPPAAGSAPPPTPSPSPIPEARKLIRNASVALEVAAFDPAIDGLGAAATQAGGGYVATVNSSRRANGKRQGTVVIKILPDRLDAFLLRLRDLGEVKSQTVAAEDVTKDYFDTDARLRNARRMEDRLLKLLEEAKGKITEILQVEKELARVREGIETMQGQLQLYDALVRYATVTLEVSERDLQQPAAFLLRQNAELALLATDVEKTYADARRAADDAHAQIVTSELVRSQDGRVTATLSLRVAPEAADGFIAKVKGLGRVQHFDVRDERVAQNGDANAGDAGAGSASAAPGAAKLERGPVALNLTIRHDEETPRSVSLMLTGLAPATLYEQARTAAAAAGADIVSSHFNRTQALHGNGTLTLRVPARSEAGLLDAVRPLGRVSDFNVTRSANAGADAEGAPVLLTLNFADEPVGRRIAFNLVTPDLDAGFEKTRAAALAAGGEITGSNFNQPQNGHGSASLVVTLPAPAEPALLAAVRALGRTNGFTVERDNAQANQADAAAGPQSAPVLLTIRLADEEPPVQQTSATITCASVDRALTAARQMAAGAGAKVSVKGFRQENDGEEVSDVEFRLPLKAYPGLMARLNTLGETSGLRVTREDYGAGSGVPAEDAAATTVPPAVQTTAAAGVTDAPGADDAPVAVAVKFFHPGHAIRDEFGFGATIRRTLGQAVAALAWSVRMIGVAVAFLAPWAALILAPIGLARLLAAFRRRRQARFAAAGAGNAAGGGTAAGAGEPPAETRPPMGG